MTAIVSQTSWISYQEHFTSVAQQYPNQIAVVDQESHWSYAQLHQETNALSIYLQTQGVCFDDLIVILMPSSYGYLASSLATLKAGAAFLPIPIDLPPFQIETILHDACPKVIITTSTEQSLLPNTLTFEHHLYIFDDIHALKVLAQTHNETTSSFKSVIASQEQHLAFATYTSGTTGKPKGVLQIQKALVTSYQSRYQYCPYQTEEKVACNIFFMWEFLRPLMYGAAVYVIPDSVVYTPKKLASFLERHQITETLFTPSAFQRLIRSLPAEQMSTQLSHLRTVWLNGEVVSTQLVKEGRQALPTHTRLLNTYSICECHDVSNSDLDQLDIEDINQNYDGVCPVGFAVDGVEIAVQTDQGLQTNGQGELYIGGQGLGRGYLHLDELTQQRFPIVNQVRYYATGDLAEVNERGEITIKGRIGSMVKMRGYSVYLGAIEEALRQHPSIQDVYVFLRGAHLSQYLVAFLVGDQLEQWIDAHTQTSSHLRTWLSDHIPAYMIPSKWVTVDQFPVDSISGKLDQKTLWALEKEDTVSLSDLAKQPQDTLTECLSLLRILWAQVLEVPDTSITDETHFFEAGGHSLSAVDLMNSIEMVFALSIEGDEIYERSTFLAYAHTILSTRFPDFDVTHDHSHAQELSSFWHDDDLKLEFPQSHTWYQHTTQDLVALAKDKKTVHTPLHKARSIFLTGATGYLGLGIVETLLKEVSNDCRIYCLVRADQNQSGTERLSKAYQQAQFGNLDPLIQAERIKILEGDITQVDLGLTPSVYQALSQEIDLVFHCAAMVNLQAPYQQTKISIVDGTRHMIYFATHKKLKTFHHISTNSVLASSNPIDYVETRSLNGLDSFLTDGYSQAKWVAENLIQTAMSYGMPSTIYRPGNIGPHTHTHKANPNDLQTLIWQACLQTRSAPQDTEWLFEMTPVNYMARIIIGLAQLNHPQIRYNLVHTNPIQADSLFRFMYNQGWIDTLYPNWTAWKNELIRFGKTHQNQSLQILGASMSRFHPMLQKSNQYPIDHVLGDLPSLRDFLIIPSNLTQCLEQLKQF